MCICVTVRAVARPPGQSLNMECSPGLGTRPSQEIDSAFGMADAHVSATKKEMVDGGLFA